MPRAAIVLPVDFGLGLAPEGLADAQTVQFRSAEEGSHSA